MVDTLDSYLRASVAQGKSQAVALAIRLMATAAVKLHGAIAAGVVPNLAPTEADNQNASGERQKPLDLFADQVFLDAARAAGVAVYGSEEQGNVVVLGEGGIALAIDPLDGSSNIETNIAVGTIFSLLPYLAQYRADPETAFRQVGTAQLAGGFFMYGAQLTLVLTLGDGTRIFRHAPGTVCDFRLVTPPLKVPAQTAEFSINASNRRHWPQGVRRYIEDVESGLAGPRSKNFGMRYVGSLVADTYRILQCGGVFLYPGDERKGYAEGRLRQLYEANPIAFCIEQAGGAATNGEARILDSAPTGLHARTPLVFGSYEEVATVTRYAIEPLKQKPARQAADAC